MRHERTVVSFGIRHESYQHKDGNIIGDGKKLEGLGWWRRYIFSLCNDPTKIRVRSGYDAMSFLITPAAGDRTYLYPTSRNIAKYAMRRTAR